MSQIKQGSRPVFVRLFKRNTPDALRAPVGPSVAPEAAEAAQPVSAEVARMSASDPLVPYLQSVKGAVDVEALRLDSPMLTELRQQGVKVVVPLINQGEFIGLITLGERLSDQGYAGDDHKLLVSLATQAAPAFRVANLVRQQRKEAAEREQIEQEMRVARLIQQTLLPREQLALPGWKVEAVYQPARAVGGDFYDFVHLPDGRVGIVIGDVTDKGVPAALVMAMTRTLLRDAAKLHRSPGAILDAANDGLCGDIPEKMFVTCFYAILDPQSGKLIYANAGHDVPYVRTRDGVVELRARGMPLGLMPGMAYEEKEMTLSELDTALFYTDGLVEAHDPNRNMLGFGKVKELIAAHATGTDIVPYLLRRQAEFTGPDWEQEDDTTMIVLQRERASDVGRDSARTYHEDRTLRKTEVPTGETAEWKVLAEFNVASEPGNERGAMRQVAEAIAAHNLHPPKLERLKTAVAEATMNAIEHGNDNDPSKLVNIVVCENDRQVAVHITDQGGALVPEPIVPDLDAKLAGLQTPRGWGLFLIQNMVDEMNVRTTETSHTVELIANL